MVYKRNEFNKKALAQLQSSNMKTRKCRQIKAYNSVLKFNSVFKSSLCYSQHIPASTSFMLPCQGTHSTCLPSKLDTNHNTSLNLVLFLFQPSILKSYLTPTNTKLFDSHAVLSFATCLIRQHKFILLFHVCFHNIFEQLQQHKELQKCGPRWTFDRRHLNKA